MLNLFPEFSDLIFRKSLTILYMMVRWATLRLRLSSSDCLPRLLRSEVAVPVVGLDNSSMNDWHTMLAYSVCGLTRLKKAVS